MNVAIYGAGAMGTVLGAYISKAGYDIDLISRNKAHITALQKQGATIIGTTQFQQKVTAYTSNQLKDTYDIIFLMTKQTDNIKIVAKLKSHLAENGILCTMQNGIPEPEIASIIGANRTVGCAMSWGATFHGDGVSELTSDPNRDNLTFTIGKYGIVDETLFQYIITLLDSMGNVTISYNFIGFRWSKLLINASFSGLSVVTGATFGEICKHRKSKLLALSIMKECIEVAKKANIEIEPIQGKDIVKLMDYANWIQKQFSLLIIPIAMRKHKSIKSSMLRDIINNRQTEIDAINGVVYEYGQKYNVQTPINEKIISIVKIIEKHDLHPNWENIDMLYSLL